MARFKVGDYVVFIKPEYNVHECVTIHILEIDLLGDYYICDHIYTDSRYEKYYAPEWSISYIDQMCKLAPLDFRLKNFVTDKLKAMGYG